MRLLGALLAVVVLATGCADAPELPEVGQSEVDVDTPALRKLKRQAAVEECAQGTGEHVAGGLPDVTLPCLGGGEDVNVSTLRGPLVVNLWASWCGPCRRELPIYDAFHEKNGDQVAVLGIDYQDTQPAAALELVKRSGVTYPLLADPQSALSLADPLPNLQGLPFLALVDESGKVVHQEFVEIRSLGELEGLVEQHLGVAL